MAKQVNGIRKLLPFEGHPIGWRRPIGIAPPVWPTGSDAAICDIEVVDLSVALVDQSPEFGNAAGLAYQNKNVLLPNFLDGFDRFLLVGLRGAAGNRLLTDNLIERRLNLSTFSLNASRALIARRLTRPNKETQARDNCAKEAYRARSAGPLGDYGVGNDLLSGDISRNGHWPTPGIQPSASAIARCGGKSWSVPGTVIIVIDAAQPSGNGEGIALVEGATLSRLNVSPQRRVRVSIADSGIPDG